MCNIGLSSKKNMTFLEDLRLVPPTEFPPFIRDRLCCGPAGSLFQKQRNGLSPQGSSRTQGLPGYDCFKAGERGSGRRGLSPATLSLGSSLRVLHPLTLAHPAPQITAVVSMLCRGCCAALENNRLLLRAWATLVLARVKR